MLSSEVCKAAGVTYRQLDYWCREGLVKPGVEDATGSGHVRKWHEDDVLILKVIDGLVTCNIPQEVVRSILPKLNDGRFVLAHWEEAMVVSTWDEVRKWIEFGKPWTVLDLDAMSHVDSKRRKRTGHPKL